MEELFGFFSFFFFLGGGGGGGGGEMRGIQLVAICSLNGRLDYFLYTGPLNLIYFYTTSVRSYSLSCTLRVFMNEWQISDVTAAWFAFTLF